MVAVCFYFQVHKPFRLKPYRVFEIGNDDKYFDEEKTRESLISVANKCYLPMNKLILELIEKTNKQFKFSFSISGVVIEQMKKYAPDVLESFKKLAETGCVEFLAETYYHSLSFLYSRSEFKKQVEMHRDIVREEFGCEPKVFRNTELIYMNEVANFVEDMGYKGILAEGWHTVLDKKSPNFLYDVENSNGDIALFLRNHQLSEDIAFRFSDKRWEEYPLTPKKYSKWIENSSGDVVNLFMNYETFGEKHSKETGIFEFMKEFPLEFLKNPENKFVMPSEALELFEKKEKIDVPFVLSAIDYSRDLSPWIGNKMQDSAAMEMFEVEDELCKIGDERLLKSWRRLSSSDNFYNMCTKYWKNGDCPEYYAVNKNPYDEYIYFMNALNDIIVRMKLKEKESQKGSVSGPQEIIS